MSDDLPSPLEPGLDQFVAAAKNGDIDSMLPYLERYDAFVKDPQLGEEQRQQQWRYEKVQRGLHVAAGEDHAEIVDLLLTKGFVIDTGTEVRALTSSGRKSSLDTFKILLKHDWDVNHSMGHIGGSLALAAFRGNTLLVRWLLSNGAKPDQNLRQHEFTALECAIQGGHLPSAKLLVEAGAQIATRSALPIAAAKGYTNIIEYLVDCGADIDEVPSNDEVIFYKDEKDSIKNALCAAAENGRLEVIRLLLKRGADRSVTDTAGQTALQLAESNGYKDCVELLK